MYKTNKSSIESGFHAFIKNSTAQAGSVQADDYINPSGIHYARWLCECSCDKHTRKAVAQSILLNGESQSCGCLSKEMASKTHKKYNDYNYSNDYGVGYCHNTGSEFYFDWEDLDKIKNFCWREAVHIDG